LSGITGIVSHHRKLVFESENIRKMTEILKHRGKKAQKIKTSDYGLFGCTSMICPKDDEKKMPFSVFAKGSEYTICFDGLIYNTQELKNELKNKNIRSENMNDAELILNLYLCMDAGCLKKLNGIFAFAIWNNVNKELFVARDRFGIKPLYYTIKNETFYFSSEIKGLLANPDIDAVIDKQGMFEILGLGPAHTPGCGVFCGIKEILPGHFGVYNKHGFNTHKYWQLQSHNFEESFDECLENTGVKVLSAIDSQLEEKGRNMAFFLSGGLDSSAITALAAQKYGDGINTFSLQYKGNDEFFTPTEYQPDSDEYYISIMQQRFNTNHHVITVETEELVKYLTNAVEARDLPGMADIDSSLYFICKEMGKSFDGALSGECADEVFGGYPWFHRQEDFDAKIFPWAKNTDLRRNIVSPDIFKADEINDYIINAYNRSISEVPGCVSDNIQEKRRREIAYLNLKWFMYSLGERSERIGMNCGLEIRMPFCDHKLVEYVWNIPWEFKKYKEREKGLLRAVFDGILPEEVLWRKKSPFPKTHNPEFESLIKENLFDVLNNKNSILRDIINVEYIEKLMSQTSDYGKPWYGQLMALPQLYAYLFQIDYWLKKYHIRIKP